MKLYWGKPCKNGHHAPKMTSGGCILCKKESDARRYKEVQAGDLRRLISSRCSSARSRERKSGIPEQWRVTKEDIWALPRPEYCPVFPWVKMEYKASGKGSGERNPGTASLDRIDNNNRSYKNGNARWISDTANRAKRTGGLREFKALYEDARRCSVIKDEMAEHGREAEVAGHQVRA